MANIYKKTFLCFYICCAAFTFKGNSQTPKQTNTKAPSGWQSLINLSDDNKHFLAGHTISSGTGYTMYFLTNKPALSALCGALTGIAAGIVKEKIHDQYLGKGTPSAADGLTTGFGSTNAAFSISITINIERKNNKLHFLFR